MCVFLRVQMPFAYVDAYEHLSPVPDCLRRASGRPHGRAGVGGAGDPCMCCRGTLCVRMGHVPLCIPSCMPSGREFPNSDAAMEESPWLARGGLVHRSDGMSRRGAPHLLALLFIKKHETAQQPHAPDQRKRGDFVRLGSEKATTDLSNLYSRWQVMGSVSRCPARLGAHDSTPPSNPVRGCRGTPSQPGSGLPSQRLPTCRGRRASPSQPGRGVRVSAYQPAQGHRVNPYQPGRGVRASAYQPGRGVRASAYQPGRGRRVNAYQPGRGVRASAYQPGFGVTESTPVSYTHLDVYKRQVCANFNHPALASCLRTRYTKH